MSTNKLTIESGETVPLESSTYLSRRRASPLLRGLRHATAAAALILSPVGPGLAATPSIHSFGVEMGYDAGADLLTLRENGAGLVVGLVDGRTLTVDSGSYRLSARIDQAGNVLQGTLAIGGGVSGLNLPPNTTLLRGDITGVSFESHPDADALVFEVAVIDSAALLEYGATAQVTVISTSLPFNPAGRFAGSFLGRSQASANVSP